MKKLKHIIVTLVWTLVGLYLVVSALVNIPGVQSFIADGVASLLRQKLGTEVRVGRVDLGWFNRIIVDELLVRDQRGKVMLQAPRVSVSLSLVGLMQGRVEISSAQLFGLKAQFYRASAKASPNFQFVLDSLSSRRPTSSDGKMPISVGSLIIRHCSVRWDQWDVPRSHVFNPSHLFFERVSGHLSLHHLSSDSLSLYVKQFSLREQSGFQLDKLSLRLLASRRSALLTHLQVALPHSQVQLDSLRASYRMENGKLQWPSLQYSVALASSYVSTDDLSPFVPFLSKMKRTLVLQANVVGTSTLVRVKRLEMGVPLVGSPATLASPTDVHLLLSGSVTNPLDSPRWFASVSDLSWTDEGLSLVAQRLPAAVERLGRLRFVGEVGGKDRAVALRGQLNMGVGAARVMAAIDGDKVRCEAQTRDVDLGRVLGQSDWGNLSAHLRLNGDLKQREYAAQGTVESIAYKGQIFRDLRLDGSYVRNTLQGRFAIDDPVLSAMAQGKIRMDKQNPGVHLALTVRHLKPSALVSLPDGWRERSISGKLDAHFDGATLQTGLGSVRLSNFRVEGQDFRYQLDSLRLLASSDEGGHHLALHSDFGEAHLSGQFDYSSLWQSVQNLVLHHLPSLQQLTPLRVRTVQANDFQLRAEIRSAEWLRALGGVKVELHAPLQLSAAMSTRSGLLKLDCQLPRANLYDQDYRNVRLQVSTLADTLQTSVQLSRLVGGQRWMDVDLRAVAAHDQLLSSLSVDNHADQQRLKGTLHTVTQLYKHEGEATTARVAIQPSSIHVGDSLLTVQPSVVLYRRGRLEVHRFSLSHASQQLTVDGVASASPNDSLTVNFSQLNVEYIMELIRFHSVDFSGLASGRAVVRQLFSKPQATAQLQVQQFHFQQGQLGLLNAKVDYNAQQNQVDIHALAVDSLGSDVAGRRLFIDGYVSPKRNYIDLKMKAERTRGNFIESFCSSFMNKVALTVDGDVRLWGSLSALNLTGQLVGSGQMGISSLNTVYSLENDTIQLGYNEIIFPHCKVRDIYGAEATISGSLHHQHLSRLSFDFDVQAQHFLSYDWDGRDGSSFYGTVFATGSVNIVGRPGEVIIKVEGRPERGSLLVYNAAHPDELSSQEFIHWESRDSISQRDTLRLPALGSLRNLSTDVRLNMAIDAQPEGTLRVLMDPTTGDYIDLNGEGMLRASYYNKGGLEVYGNYQVQRGVYKLTVQGIIHRDFHFLEGGTISFGGDPYAAALRLKAIYTVNSVPLSDLQLGRSFSGNNIRVDCLMDISGTPERPRVDFSLDMPTVSSEAKQMIHTILTSEEEMNQQVLYLLAVGRFFAQPSNNASAETNAPNRTSLAMQSILSGQLSQQINNVLGTVINNTNWNFGANISTGDEGWNNAEYEGMLSGSLLNNRLLINGQFGYRDNANATTSFIGDFDIRYLIVPNGNFSIRVYNQANDRYFTRSTLNTQGIGFVLKHDFQSWRDLFRRKRRLRLTPSSSSSKSK